MRYNIKGTDLSISDELRSYIEKKLGSFDKFVSNLDASRTDVEVEFMRGEAGMYRAELMLHDPALPEPLRVEARGAALHEAIDLSMGELFRELTRAKKKRISRVRRGASKIKEFVKGLRDRF